MPGSRNQVAIVAAFGAIYVLWGSTYLSLAMALKSMPPFLLMAARCLVGGAILLCIARLANGELPSGKAWLLAVICGICFFVGCHGILAYAQQRVPSGLAAILLATIPLWITVINLIVPGSEQPTWRGAALLIPGVAGVALIAGREATASHSPVHFSDLLLLLGAALSWAAGTSISERRSATLSPLALSGMELISGGLILFGIGLLCGETARFSREAISSASIAGWLYLTVAGTVVAFAAYVWLLKQVPATIVATYTFINPIIAVLLGWVFLNEQPGLWTLLGAGLVIASVAGVLLEKGRIPKSSYRPRSGAISNRSFRILRCD